MSITINAPQFTCGVLRAKWNKSVSEDELPTSYELVLGHAIKSNNCRFWLLDLSQRNWVESNFMSWLASQFAARATQVLGGPVFIAYLAAAHQRASVSSWRVATIRHRAAESDLYTCFFENAAQAIDWLRDQQNLEPAAPGLLSLSLPTA